MSQTQGFKYFINILPHIATLSILRLIDDTNPSNNWHTVLITNIALEDAYSMIKWYEMEERGRDYYMTKEHWAIPSHEIIHESGRGNVIKVPAKEAAKLKLPKACIDKHKMGTSCHFPAGTCQQCHPDN